MRRALVLENASCETLGILEPMLERDGFIIEKRNATNQDSIPDRIESYDSLIVLGGPASVYDNHDYLRKEQKLIQNAVSENVPTLGICLGSQLIASAVGGRVYKGSRKEIGWYPVQVTEEGKNDIFEGIKKNGIIVFQWHGDTYDLPKECVLLAKSEHYPAQAFRYGSAIGIQFHLEVSKDMAKRWLHEYRSELESVSHYIDKHDVVNGFDIYGSQLSEYGKKVYENFSKIMMKK